MANITKIKNELETKGYIIEMSESYKNGIKKETLIVKNNNSNVGIVLYYDQIEKMEDEKEVLEIVEKNIVNETFDANEIFSVRYLTNNTFIGIQAKSDEKIIKTDIENLQGIEKYLYVKLNFNNGNGTIKIRKEMIQDVDLEKLWEVAELNTFEQTNYFDLSHFLGFDTGVPMFFITNNSQHLGAANILDIKKVKEIAEKIGTDKLIALPSSIHEFILVDYNTIPLDMACEMVKTVNANEVDEKDKLIDSVYILEI